MTVAIYIPTNSARRFPFSTPSLAFIVCIFFDDGHSDWCEVIPYQSFDLYFSNNNIEQLFMSLLAICMASMGKGLYRSSAHFFIFFNIYIYIKLLSCLYILEIDPWSVTFFEIIFSHSQDSLFISFMVYIYTGLGEGGLPG